MHYLTISSTIEFLQLSTKQLVGSKRTLLQLLCKGNTGIPRFLPQGTIILPLIFSFLFDIFSSPILILHDASNEIFLTKF